MSKELRVADIVSEEVLKKAMTLVDTDKIAKIVAARLNKEIPKMLEEYIDTAVDNAYDNDKMGDLFEEIFNAQIEKVRGALKLPTKTPSKSR